MIVVVLSWNYIAEQFADKAKEVIGMAKGISGPFEDEQKQVEWQKEVLREEYEREENLYRRTFFHRRK